MQGQQKELLLDDDDQDQQMGGVGPVLVVASATERLSDSDYNQLIRLIEKIPNLTTKEAQADFEAERTFEKFLFILDLYQEQPHLLDSKLESLLEPLLSLARDTKRYSVEVKKLAFMFLMHITKVRGYKTMLRHLPHEVTDLEPTLRLLESQDASDHSSFALRYMLLLWLVIIAKIPFDLRKFDSDRNSRHSLTINRLLAAGRTYLASVTSDKCGEMAALLLASVLTRPDVKEEYLESEIKTQLNNLKQLNVRFLEEERRCIHICMLLALIFKHGKREDLLPYASFILDEILTSSLPSSTQKLLRKLGVKLVQRIGLIFLKPRVAAWRYQRGNRSITDNLRSACVSGASTSEEMDTTEDEGVSEFQEELGNVVEFLLSHLKDRETVVRWSAAKGLGRVTSRLPRDMGDEVVSSILELFSIRETDAAWHGGCLSLAELGRRGFLLPSRLEEVVPIVIKALNYEEQQGRFSIGAHVRDAACYLCWSFARAYNPCELTPYVEQLASALLGMAVFDREVNCRRAASAAFQENVGRQGSFPHGIEILTVADYFAVGQRNHCYKELSVFVAAFPEYTETMITHLVDMKIGHWDLDIRTLSAEALGKLTELAPDYMRHVILRMLFEGCTGIDLFRRQGSVLAVAEIVVALLRMDEPLGEQLAQDVANIPREMQAKQFLRGMGQDLIRSALNTFMAKLSTADFVIEDVEKLKSWHKTLDENLCHFEENIREGAALALAPFCRYYRDKPTELSAIVSGFVEKLKTNKKETERIGAALALGNLPRFVFSERNQLKLVMEGLVETVISRTDLDRTWAQARKDSLGAIGRIVLMTVSELTEDTLLCGDIFHCYMVSLSDYTTDSRGDIGRVVREAGLEVLKEFLLHIGKNKRGGEIVTHELLVEAISAMIKQCCEKIDSTRKIGGEALAEVVHDDMNQLVRNIPNLELLRRIFWRKANVDASGGATEDVKWMSGTEAFPRLLPLLSCPDYQYAALSGFIVSAGGMTESTMKAASDSLLNFVGELKDCGDQDKLDRFLEAFTAIAENSRAEQRVIGPLLNVLDQILVCDYLDVYNGRADECQYLRRLLEVAIEATAKKKNVGRVLAGLSVFCSMLQFESTSYVWQRALRQTLLSLTHPYLRVRRGAASKLYEALLTFGCLDNHTEIVMSYLAETDWDKDPKDLRDIQLEIADRMGIEIKILTPRSQS